MIADWETGVRWWGWVPGIVATAVFWALVIWAIVVLARWARSGGNGPAGPDGPDGPRDTGGPADDGDGPGQALARRYTAGEIGAAEYHRHAGALRSGAFAVLSAGVLAHLALQRRRMRAWDADWLAVAPRWTGPRT